MSTVRTSVVWLRGERKDPLPCRSRRVEEGRASLADHIGRDVHRAPRDHARAEARVPCHCAVYGVRRQEVCVDAVVRIGRHGSNHVGRVNVLDRDLFPLVFVEVIDHSLEPNTDIR